MIEDDIEYDDIDGGGWQRQQHQWQQVPVGSRQETAAATVRPISSWSLCDVTCIDIFFCNVQCDVCPTNIKVIFTTQHCYCIVSLILVTCMEVSVTVSQGAVTMLSQRLPTCTRWRCRAKSRVLVCCTCKYSATCADVNGMLSCYEWVLRP